MKLGYRRPRRQPTRVRDPILLLPLAVPSGRTLDSHPFGGAFYLAATDGYVFIANQSDGTITRIGDRALQTVGLPVRIAAASHSSNTSAAYSIPPDADAIQATGPSTDTISRIQAQP